MILIRKITLGLLLASAFSALVMAGLLLWNYQQWQQLSTPTHTSVLDERTRLVQDRVELLNKRLADTELLVLVLLGASGLFSIVFVLSSYISSVSFARQADRSIADMKDQIVSAMGDLQDMKEKMKKMIEKAAAAPAPAEPSPRAQTSEDLAATYRSLAAGCTSSDPTQAILHLHRALALAPSSDIHYDLACANAAAGNYEQAVQELAAAFEHQSRALDDRLALDIEEGGQLYELASKPPFDKAVNDILLNVVL